MASRARMNFSSDDLHSANSDERETLLEHDSEPDEDMIFNRSGNSDYDVKVHRKIDNVRIQIRDVTEVMRDNVEKIMERGDRLEDLQMASDRLNIAGNEFRDAARKAQRRAWMQNFRSRMIVIGIAVIIIICIIVLDVVVLYLVVK